MKRLVLEGVFPALVTPFTKDEEIDEDAFRRLIRHVIERVNGIVPCGTTGEFANLSLEERKRIIEIAVDEVNGKKAVIAGTGDASTKHAIELARHAGDVGADACLVVNPYFLRPSDKGAFQHFWSIAELSDLPVIMYNIPQTTDSYIPRRVIEDLAKHENIIGLKDSSGNLTYTLEVLEKVRGRINVMIGHDEVVLPALASGCSGMILASAQVFPDIWQEVYRAVKENNLEKARELQMRVQKLTRIFCRHGGAVPVKVALKMMGIDCGKTRMPLKVGGALIHEDKEEIRLELEKIGKIKCKEYELAVPDKPLKERFENLGISREEIEAHEFPVASVTKGEGSERVIADFIAGKKSSAVGKAFAIQLTHPKRGYEALTTILEPNLTIKPASIIVPMIELKNLRQANMIYGPVQSSFAKAIADSVDAGIISKEMLNSYVFILKILIHPNALERDLVYENCYKACLKAIRDAFKGGN